MILGSNPPAINPSSDTCECVVQPSVTSASFSPASFGANPGNHQLRSSEFREKHTIVGVPITGRPLTNAGAECLIWRGGGVGVGVGVGVMKTVRYGGSCHGIYFSKGFVRGGAGSVL